jgi:hypothetical protein
MNIEQQQIRIKLTENPVVLDALKRRNGLRKINGKDTFVILFDSKELTFEVGGGPRAFGESTAKALIRSSVVCLGNADKDPKKCDDMIAEMVPALVEAGRFDIARELPENKCQFCGHEADSKADLATHVSSECPEVLKLATAPVDFVTAK